MRTPLRSEQRRPLCGRLPMLVLTAALVIGLQVSPALAHLDSYSDEMDMPDTVPDISWVSIQHKGKRIKFTVATWNNFKKKQLNDEIGLGLYLTQRTPDDGDFWGTGKKRFDVNIYWENLFNLGGGLYAELYEFTKGGRVHSVKAKKSGNLVTFTIRRPWLRPPDFLYIGGQSWGPGEPEDCPEDSLVKYTGNCHDEMAFNFEFMHEI